MSKLKISTREIGSVCIFDLIGDAEQDSLQEVAGKIQRNIRRHRLQRVILNLQMVPSLEPLGLRRLLAACIRPQRSILFGVSKELETDLENTYLPRNIKVCRTEKEVAEDFGPFLLARDKELFPAQNGQAGDPNSIGVQLERRRSKRMHVALPIDVRIFPQGGESFVTKAIATNIGEGGLYAEYLDLDAAKKIEKLEPFQGVRAEIIIFPSANFPEEYHLEGKINRKEFRKKQIGIAIEFAVNSGL